MSFDSAVPVPAVATALDNGPAGADVSSSTQPESTHDASRGLFSAYLSLTKPRIALMVLLTTAVGYWLGARASSDPLDVFLTLAGTACVAGGASVWNQILERYRDSLMRRTFRRPIPKGEVGVVQASSFGLALTIFGVAMLWYVEPLAALVALTTFLLYVLVYTPLKPVTTLNTAVGAIPGALPPVIGWAAATGQIGIEAWALFVIVFLWQFPHFLAIAWIHRDDYARGGHRMLPSVDPDGDVTGRQATIHALILIPCSLFPAIVGLAGSVYFVGAIALGLFYTYYAWQFWRDVSNQSARKLLRASILYLPAILLLLVINPHPA